MGTKKDKGLILRFQSKIPGLHAILQRTQPQTIFTDLELLSHRELMRVQISQAVGG